MIEFGWKKKCGLTFLSYFYKNHLLVFKGFREVSEMPT